MVLILRCADIDKTRVYYERHGYSFTKEKHGDGPEHYSWAKDDIVVELYPAENRDGRRAGETTIMLATDFAALGVEIITAEDPDGRRILLIHEDKK